MLDEYTNGPELCTCCNEVEINEFAPFQMCNSCLNGSSEPNDFFLEDECDFNE